MYKKNENAVDQTVKKQFNIGSNILIFLLYLQLLLLLLLHLVTSL